MRSKCGATGDGYAISQQRSGDTTDVMLDYVGYELADLRAAYAEQVAEARVAGGGSRSA